MRNISKLLFIILIALIVCAFNCAGQKGIQSIENKMNRTTEEKPVLLSPEQAKFIIIESGFFDSRKNTYGKGFSNLFKVYTIKGDKVIVDEAAGLMWQQGGSDEMCSFNNAKEYIKQLNQKGFAGHQDWRLPTLIEAMSLVEPKENENRLFIDSVFDKTQRYIFTSYLGEHISGPWAVSFANGSCGRSSMPHSYNYVRAVRTIEYE